MRRLYSDLSDLGEINPASLNSDGVRLLVKVIQAVAPKGSLLRSLEPVVAEEVRKPGDVVNVVKAIHHATYREVEVFATVGRAAAWLSYQFAGPGQARATLQINFSWMPTPVRVKAALSGDREAMALCTVDTKWFITDRRGEPVLTQRPISLAEALHTTAEMD